MHSVVMRKMTLVLVAAVLFMAGTQAMARAAETSRGSTLNSKWMQKIHDAKSAAAGETETSTSSLEQDPRAIVKEGMLIKGEGGFISLLNEDTRRIDRYMVAANCRFSYDNSDYDPFYRENEISFESIPDSSIVKLVLIEGQVQEIILLARPS